MEISKVPILLTSSVVAHDKGVQLQDRNLRENLAIESVRQWRLHAPENPIVLCDGSGFDFSPLVQSFSSQVPVECLHFENDPALVQRYGRGFGEGEIVRHALSHSLLIGKAASFAKCTSKLWVENFLNSTASWNGQMLFKGVFDDAFSLSRPTRFAYIDTRFYVASVATYQQYFIDAHHQIDTESGHGLEECFRDIFVANKFQRCLMTLPPVICGVGGGTGRYYKNTKLRRFKERWRYQLIKNSPLFHTWFV